MKRLVVFLIVSFLMGHGLLAIPDCPIRQVEDKSYYEYTVKPGDGLFAIARSFGIRQSELLSANPGLTTDIRPGQVILVPITEDKSEKLLRRGVSDKIHVVEPKQTLYGISRKYRVSIDSITQLNPFVSRGIRPGDTLVIAVGSGVDVPVSVSAPVQEVKRVEGSAATSASSSFHVVQRKETLYAISRKYGMPIHEIIALNPGASKKIRTGDTLVLDSSYWSLPVVLPVADTEVVAVADTDTVERVVADTVVIQPIVTNPVSDTGALNIVYLLPFHTDQATVHKSTLRFVEFYRGALVALEKAKGYGISASVRTFDTGRTKADIEALLALPEMADADIIIGPAYSDQLEPVISFARKHHIATIIPFSPKVPEHLFYPGLIQFNPPCEYINSQSIAAVASDRNQRYVIGRFNAVDKEDKALADELHATLAADSVAVIDTMLDFASLRYIVEQVGSQPTTFLMASSAPADVNVMLDSLAAYQRQNIRVWGFDKWATLVTKYPNTVYTSLFRVQETQEYVNGYNEMFGAHTIVTEPRYDLIGYDLTTLATRALSQINDTLYHIAPLPSTEYMQSSPLFIVNQNRMVNNRLTVFHWDGVVFRHTDFIELPKTFADTLKDEE